MGVIADERRLDLEVAQELARVAGIFRGDEVRLFQHPKGPEGDVLQVADGRGDDVERADGAHLKRRSGIISTWGSSPARVTATTSKRTGVPVRRLALR